MAKKKQIKILITVLALLLAAYGLVFCIGNEEPYEESSESVTGIDLKESDIVKISYTDTENMMSFVYKDGKWNYEKDLEFPVKQSSVEELISELLNITANRSLEEAENASSYGLDDPSYTVTLTEENGTETEIKIGDIASNSDYYLTADDGEHVYTVNNMIPETLSFDEMQFLKTESFPDVNNSNITALSVSQGGNSIISCSDENEDEAEQLKDYGKELSYITLDDCVNYHTGEDELNSYGLNESDRKIVKASYSDNEETKNITFYLGKKFEENEVSYVYIQLKGSDMVYKIDATFVEDIYE